MLVSADRVRRQILNVLHAWGMPADLAETTAEAMAETDLTGVDSHGISMLMMYEGLRRAGQIDLRARPRVLRDAPSLALVDGGANLGHPVAAAAMGLAADKALATGIGAVGARNSHHFGAAGHYARTAAARGVVGADHELRAHGADGADARHAAPARQQPHRLRGAGRRNKPFVLDMATTTVAANKVKVYELNGKPVPEGWVVDERGAPVTDAAAAMDVIFRRPGGGLTPLGGAEATGGHKGYGLGLMVQILSATLTGAAFAPLRGRAREAGDPDDIGHFFLALDPRAFRPEGGFEDDLDAMVEALRAAPPADPGRPVLVPGDPEEAERERRLREGIPVPPALDRHIRDICGRCGAAYVLQDG